MVCVRRNGIAIIRSTCALKNRNITIITNNEDATRNEETFLPLFIKQYWSIKQEINLYEIYFKKRFKWTFLMLYRFLSIDESNIENHILNFHYCSESIDSNRLMEKIENRRKKNIAQNGKRQEKSCFLFRFVVAVGHLCSIPAIRW